MVMPTFTNLVTFFISTHMLLISIVNFQFMFLGYNLALGMIQSKYLHLSIRIHAWASWRAIFSPHQPRNKLESCLLIMDQVVAVSCRFFQPIQTQKSICQTLSNRLRMSA